MKPAGLCCFDGIPMKNGNEKIHPAPYQCLSYLLRVLLMVGVLASTVACILYVALFHATVIGMLHITSTQVSSCRI